MSGDSLETLETQLEQTRAEAEFEAVLLTDFGGKIIAAARSDETSPETIGALLEMAVHFAANPEDRSRLSDAGESSFFDWQGRQVIFRWFMVGQQPYLLVVLAPPGKAYKRAAGQLVRQVQRTLAP